MTRSVLEDNVVSSSDHLHLPKSAVCHMSEGDVACALHEAINEGIEDTLPPTGGYFGPRRLPDEGEVHMDHESCPEKDEVVESRIVAFLIGPTDAINCLKNFTAGKMSFSLYESPDPVEIAPDASESC